MTNTFTAFLEQLDVDRREGQNYVATCPHHDDSQASLVVAYNQAKKKIVLRCRAGCETFDVLESMGLTWDYIFDVEPGDGEIVTVPDAPTEIVGTAEIAALRMYLKRTQGLDGHHNDALDYATRRFGLDAAAYERLGLGYDDTTVDTGTLKFSAAAYHDVPRLVVPFRRFDGPVHYVQSRALSGTPKAKWSGPSNIPGLAWGMYGLFEPDTDWTETIICEGPGDALTACAAGYQSIAIRGAGLANNSKLADELAAGLAGRRVIVAGDADRSGQAFTAEMARALSARDLSVHVLALPPGVEDLTAWHEADPDAFSTRLVTAVREAGGLVPVDDTPLPLDVPAFAADDLRMSTDVDRAALVHVHAQSTGVDFAYIDGLNWHIWSGDVWKPATEANIRHLIHEAGRALMRYMADTGKGDARMVACAGSLLNDKSAKRVLSVLASMPEMHREAAEFDSHKHLLGVANGVIDLRDGSLREYRKDDHITRKIAVDYVPTTAPGVWAKFLSEVLVTADGEPDPDYVAFMRRLIGYGITGETRDHIFPVLHGEGRNGKSRFIEALKGTFDAVTRTTSISTFEEKPSSSATPELVRLRYARLVMASESGEGRRFDEARIKSITGGDTITARDLYSAQFEFSPQFLILLATNHRPTFRGQDEGLWRRVKLLPFHAYFPEGAAADDSRMDEKLSTPEAQREILSWAVAGAVEWYRDGLGVPASIRTSTMIYRKEQDRLAEFLVDWTDATGDPSTRVKGSDIYKIYMSWCQENHESYPIGRTTFFARIAALPGVVSVMANGQRWFKGVRVLTDGEHRIRAMDAARAVDEAAG